MRSIVCLALCAVCVACSTDTSSGTGSGGAGAHALNIRIGGNGTVQSSAPSFSCHADCTQSIQSGNVVLTATADSGNTFAGWQGDCSGTGTCTLSMNADHDVTALFSANQPPPPPGSFRVTANMAGNGSGRVTSSPAGIDCPGTCTMTATSGTTVTLTAQAASGSTFAGWGGGCHGPGACTMTDTGDVWADFETTTPPPPPPPPAQCAGLGPDSPAPPRAITIFTRASCSPGMGDGTGTLGLQALGSPHGVTLHIVDGDTGQQRNFTSNYDNMDGSFTPQPNGFTGVMKAPTANIWSTHYWNRDGVYVHAGDIFEGTQLAFAPADLGGVVLAGNFNRSGLPPRHQVWMISEDVFTSWGRDLASTGPVFGLGTDVQKRSLIITGGADSGAITAQWFDSNGTALTGEFTLITGFQAGPNTWFETAPLIGGGVAVRRVDQQNDANGRPFRTAQWLVVVAAGQANAQAASQWMKDRPNTNLALARSNRAYAVLPMGAPGADCAQKVEVVAADGTSCGSFDVAIASGTCRTEDLALSWDGTPIQLMPKELSQANTCAYRWWQHALR